MLTLTDIGNAIGDHVLVVVKSGMWNRCLKRSKRRYNKQFLHTTTSIINYYYYYYYIRLMAFSRTTWASRHHKGKPFWILLKQEMMGWQWHQLDANHLHLAPDR